MPHLYDFPLAVIDVETTGTSHLRGGVIDIGVLRIEGGQIVGTYQQLVNPGSAIPAFITQLTGITNAQLSGAPSFAEIANDLEDILADCVFVAHNARFDYAFVKEEFRRTGIRYAPKTFCTVKLSRALYPQHRHHKLDALIERFNINVTARHRAFGDAQATWQAMDHMVKSADPALLEHIVKQQLRQPTLPPQLPKTTIDALPDGPGVYIFENASGGVLYVGKSINIRTRVLSHFSDDVHSSKELTLSQEVAHIRTMPTAGELGALLLESDTIKRLMPVYNRVLRRKTDMVLAVEGRTPDGYPTVRLGRYGREDISVGHAASGSENGQLGQEQILAVFRSEREAKESLVKLAKEHRLCQKLLGLQKSASACFGYHLNQCGGACRGQESALAYRIKFDQAFAGLRLHRWPYDGPIMVTETYAKDMSDSFIVDQWTVIARRQVRDQEVVWSASESQFDLDQYKIVRRFLQKPGRNVTIAPIPVYQARQLLAQADWAAD